ncbi:MAG: hypothetical protein LCH96_15880 [Actinobacteria bacterium]|nr:hypothetical protein [Actinomycetota bacterium]
MPTTVLDRHDEPLAGPGPAAPATATTCFAHAELSPQAVLDLVQAHSHDFRAVDGLVAWTERPITPGQNPEDDEGDGHAYRVLGWTTTSILRGTLSQRLDGLNPVAAFRLLDQPEIAQLDRSNRNFVVLVDVRGRRASRPVSGAISARDIDLWCTNDPSEFEGAIAVDVETYTRRFFGTGIAA